MTSLLWGYVMNKRSRRGSYEVRVIIILYYIALLYYTACVNVTGRRLEQNMCIVGISMRILHTDKKGCSGVERIYKIYKIACNVCCMLHENSEQQKNHINFK